MFPELELLHASGAPDFVPATREHMLITWLSWPEACVLGSHDTITLIEIVLDRLLVPGYYTESSETPSHYIYERGLFSVLELQSEGQTSGLVHV